MEKQPEKYIGMKSDIEQARSAVLLAKRNYENHIYDVRDDITRKQASDEFWTMISEFFGFEIDFKRDSK